MSKVVMPCSRGWFVVDEKHYGHALDAAEKSIRRMKKKGINRIEPDIMDMKVWASGNNIPYEITESLDCTKVNEPTEPYQTELQGDWVGGKVPDKITIGCYDYTINRVKEPIIVDGAKCRGKIDYQKHEIHIADDDYFSEQSKEQTLWHEIVHGIINYRNVNYGKADEETFVDELATGLYLLCKSNGLLPGQNITKEE